MNSKMKKSWGKPIVEVQLFVPQEFIAGCYKKITEHPQFLENAYLYVNYINPNQATYNSGERIDWNGRIVNGNAMDGVQGSFDIYDRSILAEFFGAPTNGASYTGFLSGFTKRATEQIKIQGGYAYYWDVNGNVS